MNLTKEACTSLAQKEVDVPNPGTLKVGTTNITPITIKSKKSKIVKGEPTKKLENVNLIL